MESSGETHSIGLEELPEDCISSLLSFTTPLDAARLALVSHKWRYAANSDTVWKKMLPKNYHQILQRAITPVPDFPSIKQLYLHLCQSILIDTGTKRIWVDRPTGKVGCMVSARDLSIVWGDGNRYWNWVSRQDSRIEEVAELRQFRWFEVKGRFECRVLSPHTRYRVSFVIRINSYGIGDSLTPFSFSLDSVNGDHTYLNELERRVESMAPLVSAATGWIYRYLEDLERPVESMAPFVRRANGWMEFVVGEFFLEEDWGIPREIGFGMENTESSIKRGIGIYGVRIEPVL